MDARDTNRPPQGWTLDTLAFHFHSIITEMDRRYEQRFIAQEHANEIAMTAAKEAVTKAETAVEKRFDNTNEWRGSMQDRDKNTMPRVEIEQRFAALSGQQHWAIGIIVTIMLAGVATIIAFLKR